MRYHAHIYWTDQTSRSIALGLREPLASIGCDLGSVHDRSIGPHPLPMYQVAYDDAIRVNVEEFLRGNADQLSILLHDDTGNHVTDHTDGARWIGNPLSLDIELLRRLDAHGEE